MTGNLLFIYENAPESTINVAFSIVAVLCIWNACSKNGPLVQVAKWLRELYLRYIFLLRGVDIVKSQYKASQGSPFKILTPTNRHVFVSSSHHIDEYTTAPSEQLSLHAVVKELIQPIHTMCKFEWKDQRGVEGLGFVRTLRSILTPKLPLFAPQFQDYIKDVMVKRLHERPELNGWSQYPAFELAECMISHINCALFLGAELSNQPGFVDIVVQFTWDTLLAAEIIRTLPPFIGPMVAKYRTNNYHASGIVYKRLYPIVDERMRLRPLYDSGVLDSSKKPDDAIQWLVDTSTRKNPWTTTRMIHEIMGVLFGSMHTTSLTLANAMIDVALNPECIEPMREEAQSEAMAEFLSKAEGLPMMDSFMKESARLNSFDCVTSRRKALTTFTFSDGLTVDKGDWICIPQHSLLRDERYFPEPHRFDAFRWVNGTQAKNATSNKPYQFSDTHDGWYMWGSGRIICPGRFLAVVIMKLALAELVTNYDCQLLDPSKPRWFHWRTNTLPSRTLTLLFRRKTTAS